jgi:hypothetical protein
MRVGPADWQFSSLWQYRILAASAARGASPQKHVYVCYMSMFVIIDICPAKQYDCLNDATARLVRFSDAYMYKTSTNHDLFQN